MVIFVDDEDLDGDGEEDGDGHDCEGVVLVTQEPQTAAMVISTWTMM